MKKIMEMIQNMKAKNEKKDNKGFSLVELIIVIAIMAILVGIVGTQVLPYINKSKEAKDFQIINSYGTAATTAYSSNAEKADGKADATKDVVTSIEINVYSPAADSTGHPTTTLANEIQTLTGYKSIDDLKKKMGSEKGKSIDKIMVTIDLKAKTITTQAYKGTTAIFDPVVTQL